MPLEQTLEERESSGKAMRTSRSFRTSSLLLGLLVLLSSLRALVQAKPGQGEAAEEARDIWIGQEKVTTANEEERLMETKTIKRDLKRFEANCDALLGDHKTRWLRLYETNERVLTIDASCSYNANGIGNVLGDFLAWFAWGMYSDRAVYVRFTDCDVDEHDAFVSTRASKFRENREIKKKQFMKERKNDDVNKEEENEPTISNKKVDRLTRKLLQDNNNLDLTGARRKKQMLGKLENRHREEEQEEKRNPNSETHEEMVKRHENERHEIQEEEMALQKSMRDSALDGSGSASSVYELSQKQRNRIHDFEKDRHELAEKRLHELRRVGGPRSKVMQELEKSEKDLAMISANIAGADHAMPPIDIDELPVASGIVEDVPDFGKDLPNTNNEDEEELSLSSDEMASSAVDDDEAELSEIPPSSSVSLEIERKEHEEADRKAIFEEEDEDRLLRELEHEGEDKDWNFLNEDVNHKSTCKDKARAMACKDRANMGLYYQLPEGKSWNLDTKTRKRIFEAIGRGPKQIFAPDDFSKSTNATFKMLENMLMNAHPWIEISLHESESNHGLIPGAMRTCAEENGGEASGAGEKSCADVGQAVIGLGYLRLAKKLEAKLFNEPVEGSPEFYNSATYATYEEVLAHQKIRGCLFHLTSRPTERLASVLMPYIDNFDNYDAIAGVHIRTGDWRDEDEISSLDKPDSQGTFEQKVNNIDELLKNAGTSIAELKTGSPESRFSAFNNLIKKGGFTRTNADSVVLKACPKINGDYFTLGKDSDAGLAPYFTCAGRAAQKAATDRVDEGKAAKFALYVSTDSPYIKKLTSELNALKDIVIGCIGTCEFHHANHAAAATHLFDPEFDDDVLSDDNYDDHTEEEEKSKKSDNRGLNENSNDPFIMSFVDAYILGLTDHNIQATASTFDMVAQRGFGHGGVPQNLENNGFTLQGVGKPWSNKHLPICEACGLEGDWSEEMRNKGSLCQLTIQAILGVADDSKFAKMFPSKSSSSTEDDVNEDDATVVAEEAVKVEEKLTPSTADYTFGGAHLRLSNGEEKVTKRGGFGDNRKIETVKERRNRIKKTSMEAKVDEQPTEEVNDEKEATETRMDNEPTEEVQEVGTSKIDETEVDESEAAVAVEEQGEGEEEKGKEETERVSAAEEENRRGDDDKEVEVEEQALEREIERVEEEVVNPLGENSPLEDEQGEEDEEVPLEELQGDIDIDNGDPVLATISKLDEDELM